MLEIDDSYSDFFSKNDLNSVDDFLSFNGGRIVSKPDKRVVREIVLNNGSENKKFFIKQETFEGFGVLFRRLRKYGYWRTSLYKESCIIDLCRDADIPVMKKVAFGEKFKFFMPVGGVLVVEEVKGLEFYEAYNKFSLRQKRRLIKAFGMIIGALHNASIDSIVRVHDLFLTDEAMTDLSKSLVLIDREHGEIKKLEMSHKKCSEQIAKILIKSLTHVKDIKKSVLAAFLSGYFEERKMTEGDKGIIKKEVASSLKKEADKSRYEANLGTLETIIR